MPTPRSLPQALISCFKPHPKSRSDLLPQISLTSTPLICFLSQILQGQRAVDGTEGGIRRHLTRQVAREGSPSGTASSDLAALQRRLDAIESILEVKNGTSSAGMGVDGGSGMDRSTPKPRSVNGFRAGCKPSSACVCDGRADFPRSLFHHQPMRGCSFRPGTYSAHGLCPRRCSDECSLRGPCMCCRQNQGFDAQARVYFRPRKGSRQTR